MDTVKRIHTWRRPLYPGESTWQLDDQGPTNPKKRNADMLRINSAKYRRRVKIDNEALIAKSERDMLAAAQER
jgi:hypothetical protein